MGISDGEPPTHGGRGSSPPRSPGKDLVRNRSSVRQFAYPGLPLGIDVAVTACIGLAMASLSVAMVSSDAVLIVQKFGWMEDLMGKGMVVQAAFAVGGMACLMVAIASTLVVLWYPMGAGSGLPEIKGFLNGNSIPRLFGSCGNWIRPVGAVLATASGLATGREGPLVTVGGALGVSVASVMASRHFRHLVKLDLKGDKRQALVVDEERFAAYKRVGCVMGSAAGLAAAFYSPLGGMLYMFEEATSSSWAPEMTFRTFAVVFVSTLCSRAVLNFVGTDVHQLVIFEDNYIDKREWFWTDLPCFVLVSVICGLCAAAYSAGAVMVWKWRSQRAHRWCFRILEAAMFAGVCALIMCSVPMLIGECTPVPLALLEHGSIFRRYTCPEGTHNQLATLLLQGDEGAIKHLYARSPGGEAISELPPLFLAITVYFVFAVGVSGLAIPTGNFVPSMFMGALVGRFARQLIAQLPFITLPPDTGHDESPMRLLAAFWEQAQHGTGFDSWLTLAQPGVYAVIGSGAFLGGFTHMTIAIIAILVEATQDIKIMPPLMLSVCVGRLVSKALLPADFAEMLIVLKGVPYLEHRCPQELEREDATAGHFCDQIPSEALLQPKVTPHRLQAALAQHAFQVFPIVELCDRTRELRCIGLVSRTRLEHMLVAAGQVYCPASDNGATVTPASMEQARRDDDATVSPASMEEARQELGSSEIGAARSPAFQARTHSVRSARSTYSTRSIWTYLQNMAGGLPSDDMEHSAMVRTGVRIEQQGTFDEEDEELRLDALVIPQADGLLPIYRLADPAPYSVPEDMPITRVYPLFARAAATAILVTPTCGDHKVFGILERRHIATHSH